MADFSTSWGPSGSPVGVQSPVQDEGIGGMLNVADTIVSGASSIFQAIGTNQARRQKAEQELFNAETISKFAQDQIALTEAVETGEITSARARTRMRANLTRAISDNPTLFSDIASAHKEVTKTSGLGQQAYEGTPEEQAEASAFQEVIKGGWVKADGTREEKLAAVEKQRNFNYNLEMLRGQQAQLAAVRAQVGLQKDQIGLQTAGINQQSARLGLEQAQLKRKSQFATAQIAMDGLTPFTSQLTQISEAKQRGEIDEVTALRLMEENYTAIDQTIRQTGAMGGNDQITNYITMYRNRLDLEKDFMTGKVSLDVYNRANELNMSRATMAITDDPTMATYAATAKVFPTTNAVMQDNVNHAVVDFLKTTIQPTAPAPNPFPSNPQQAKDVQVGFEAVKDTINNINKGTAEVGSDQQVLSWMNKALDGVRVYGQEASDPKQYKELLSFLADPNSGEFLTKNMGQVDAQKLSAAGDIIQFQYMNKVIPALVAEYESTVVGAFTRAGSGIAGIPSETNKGKATNSQIEVKFVGSGLTFQAKPGATGHDLGMRVNMLNNKVKPLANEIIRATAHMQGTKDYKQVYSELFEELFNPTKGKVEE